ncbi:MAG TPA: YtxH domain-containing protein [Armatimonadota bacterium]|jgi:gas vesicle protein|nr:YtxH domain-containing protein [Armatimonadota bacterium]HPP75000.1 YtxH domain-containing protein [Armatimonadota bacterium]
MDRNFLLGLIIGGAVGASLGLIFAPQPGADTRQKIAQSSKQAASTVRQKAKDIEERVRPAI